MENETPKKEETKQRAADELPEDPAMGALRVLPEFITAAEINIRNRKLWEGAGGA